MMENHVQNQMILSSVFGQREALELRIAQCAGLGLRKMTDAITCIAHDAKLIGAGYATKKQMNYITK